MRQWLLVFLLVLWTGSRTFVVAQGEGSPAACVLCTASTKIECPTCAGSGIRAVPCGLCGGDGSVECRTCDADKPGWIACPNRFCREGKTVWEGGDTDPCKLCAAKGRFKCPSCQGQKATRCVGCAGTGKRPIPCWTCAGGKQIKCPLCSLDPTRGGCSTCAGAGKMTCRLCELNDPKGSQPCLVCEGKIHFVCVRCRGLGYVVCEKCGASGKVRMVARDDPILPPTIKAGVKECFWCEGRGRKTCPDCARGRVDCKQCEKGQVPNACVHCLQQGSVLCDECASGGYSRWETLGDLLLAKEHPRRAALFYQSALEEAKAMTGPGPMVELHVALAEFAKLDAALKAMPNLPATVGPSDKPRLPGHLRVEAYWPWHIRQRHWPEAPAGNELAPWRDEAWMSSHRARVVARLESALARASAPGK